MDKQQQLINKQYPNQASLLEDAELALEKLTHQEVRIIKEAEELFKRQVEHVKHIDELHQHVPDVSKIQSDTKDLSSLVHSSSMLVEDVCAQFRRIDLAKAHLEDCLSKCRVQLLKLCQENINRAIAENNAKDIERFFKIFPMLNEHQDGLLRYAQYLQSKIVNQQVEEAIKSKELNQADKLASLFESIAKLIDSNQPIIETYYGPGHLIVVVKVIQKECDRLSRKLLEEFRNQTKLQQVAKMVRNSPAIPITQSQLPSSNQNIAINYIPPKQDPREVDKILNEISMIISRSEVYLSFIVQRIREDVQLKADNEAQQQANLLELYNMVFIECELNHLIQEVGGIYVMLEQFYLNESAKKAIAMDQIDIEPTNHLISSMLDDIFFIIKKCTKRAISTKSNEVFCAIINHCVTLLESTFCLILEDRLKSQQYFTTNFTTKNLDLSQVYNAIQSGRYLQSSNDLEASNTQYFSALNNLDKACDYIKTLRSILDVEIRKLKPSLLGTKQKHDDQIEKSITCLNELSQLVNKFTSIVNSSLYQLFNVSLRNKIRAELKTLLSDNPDLVAIVTSNPREMTGLAINLLKMTDSQLEQSLTPENHTRLVTITRDFLNSSFKSVN